MYPDVGGKSKSLPHDLSDTVRVEEPKLIYTYRVVGRWVNEE